MFFNSWCLPTSPHGDTTKKTNIDIPTAARTSNIRMILESKTGNIQKEAI
jgi:hypothetical protein